MSAPHEHKARAPPRVRFGVLTISDSRSAKEDRSGDLLQSAASHAGHEVAWRGLVKDEADDIRAAVERLLDDPSIDIIVTTGGTGVARRDVTPEAVTPLFERALPGFGEMFRALSHPGIGSAAMLSRATAGIARGKAVFLLPGSPDACRVAMEGLILPEAGHLVGLLHR